MSEINNRFTRFKDAPWLGYEKNILIGGAGGIGSWLALLLSRAGFNVSIVDDDKIEPLNMAGQLFPTSSINNYKSQAVTAVCKMFCGEDLNINYFNDRLEKDFYIFYATNAEIYCGAFDNMEARKIMFYDWKGRLEASNEENKKNFLLIDGRLTAEQIQIFCVTNDNYKLYENKYLFDDKDVPDAPCSFKQTSHSAAMIGSHMTAFITNFVSNLLKDEGRALPLRWEYFIPLDIVTRVEKSDLQEELDKIKEKEEKLKNLPKIENI